MLIGSGIGGVEFFEENCVKFNKAGGKGPGLKKASLLPLSISDHIPFTTGLTLKVGFRRLLVSCIGQEGGDYGLRPPLSDVWVECRTFAEFLCVFLSFS